MKDINCGWACQAPDWSSPPNFIHVGTLSYGRKDAQEVIGRAWAHEHETPIQGWKRAYRAGWRAVRVRVELA